MERTQGADRAEPRPAGWYPDPRDPGRRRYWDGDRWSELSAAADAGLTSPGGAGLAAPPTTDDTPLPRGARRGLLIGAVVVIVLLLGAVAWAVLGGGDDATTASPATTSASAAAPTSAPAASTPGDTAAAPSDPPAAPDDGAAPTTTGEDATPDASGPGVPCEADAAVLLGLLKAHPPLASFADGLTVDRTRCVGDWASAIVAAPDADRALALFRRDGGGSTLVLLGSAEPCSGLGIPAADEPTLGCGEW